MGQNNKEKKKEHTNSNRKVYSISALFSPNISKIKNSSKSCRRISHVPNRRGWERAIQASLQLKADSFRFHGSPSGIALSGLRYKVGRVLSAQRKPDCGWGMRWVQFCKKVGKRKGGAVCLVTVQTDYKSGLEN